MRRALVVLALAAGAAGAEPLRIPPLYTVAHLGVCTNGRPKLAVVSDGASATDCSAGGGTLDVYCFCREGAWTAIPVPGGGGAGTGACSSGSFVSSVNVGSAPSCSTDDDAPEVGDFGALALTGDVASSGLTTTIQANAVALGTDTTGGYAGSASEGGPATTALALNSDPPPCDSGRFGRDTAADGSLTCAQVAYSDLSGAPAAGVAGPGSSTAGQIAAFSDTSGAILAARPVLIDADGNIGMAFAKAIRADQFTVTTTAGSTLLDLADIGGGGQYAMRLSLPQGIRTGGHLGGDAGYLDFGGGNGLRIFGEGASGSSAFVGMILGDFPDRSRGLRTYISVRIVTAGVADPYDAGENQVGQTFVNDGASVMAAVQLPTLVIGLNYRAVVTDSDGLRLIADPTHAIRIAAAVSTAGGYCESTTVGDSTTILATSTGWFAIAGMGSGWACH